MRMSTAFVVYVSVSIAFVVDVSIAMVPSTPDDCPEGSCPARSVPEDVLGAASATHLLQMKLEIRQQAHDEGRTERTAKATSDEKVDQKAMEKTKDTENEKVAEKEQKVHQKAMKKTKDTENDKVEEKETCGYATKDRTSWWLFPTCSECCEEDPRDSSVEGFHWCYCRSSVSACTRWTYCNPSSSSSSSSSWPSSSSSSGSNWPSSSSSYGYSTAMGSGHDTAIR